MRNHIILPASAALLSPLAYRYLLPPSTRANICPLLVCYRELFACIQEPKCLVVTECIKECDDEHGEWRRKAREKFAHVQYPEDPNLCKYGCFDLITEDTAERFIECVGGSGCLDIEPPLYSDTCADIPQERVVPFSSIAPEIFEGRWRKVLTNSWDIWPCQSTEFFPPHDKKVTPLAWMEEWPKSDTVWRMDLNWTSSVSDRVFTMTNELTPDAGWNFDEGPKSKPTGKTRAVMWGTEPKPTGKTRAVMWGTEAHENWYVLIFDNEKGYILMNVCAYTPAVRSFDAITMLLVKEGAEFTDDLIENVEHKAKVLLGDKFGSLVRIGDCER